MEAIQTLHGTVAGLFLLQVYLCCAFLRNWSRELQTLDFQQLMMFLQRIPTTHWGPADVEPILAQSYVMRTVFTGAGSHLMHLQQA